VAKGDGTDATEVSNAYSVPPSKDGDGAVHGRRRALAALGFGSVIDGFEGGLVQTLFPVIRESLSLQTSALGVLTAISKVARMVGTPLWAGVADRYGRKKTLVVATGLWGLWTIAAGFAQNFTQLLILFGIGFLGTVAQEPISHALIVDMWRSEERGRAFGALRTMSTVGSVVGTPLIGQLANSPEGWRYGLFLMGGISIVSGVLILFFVPEPKRPSNTGDRAAVGRFTFRDAVGLLRIPTIRFMCLQVILTTSIVMLTFMITFFVDARGWDTASAATLGAVHILGMVVSSILGGFLGDWFERRFGDRGRIILMQGYLAAYAVGSALMFQLDWGKGIAVYVAMFAFGLIAGIGHPGAVLPIVGSVVPKSITATAYAFVFGFVQGGFAAVIGLVFGLMADQIGFEALFFMLITVPYLLNAILWVLMYRIYPRDLAADRLRGRSGDERSGDE
jgi:MFS family permease